jgi:iron complex outermembrane receptor protein
VGALVASLLLLTGQVAAQEDAGEGRSSSANVLMDEITVSARRRAERLLDQPMSISAMTAEQMQVQGVIRVDEVSRFVPNVTLTTDDRANNTSVAVFRIRFSSSAPACTSMATIFRPRWADI